MMSSTSATCCEAFSKSAEIYDLIHQGKDYDGEAARVLELLGPVSYVPLLDWGCGTAEFTRRFRTAGWDAAGADTSEAMLEIARRKTLRVRPGNMTIGVHARANGTINAQTCLFAAFSYASASFPPLLILENFRRAAAAGGKLVFDFINADAEIRTKQVRDIAAAGQSVRVIQGKRLVDMRLIENEVTYQQMKLASGDTEIWQEFHYMRTFTRREIAELIARAGWQLQIFTNIETTHEQYLCSGATEPYYLTVACMTK